MGGGNCELKLKPLTGIRLLPGGPDHDQIRDIAAFIGRVADSDAHLGAELSFHLGFGRDPKRTLLFFSGRRTRNRDLLGGVLDDGSGKESVGLGLLLRLLLPGEEGDRKGKDTRNSARHKNDNPSLIIPLENERSFTRPLS